jgi:hypothetical protein
MFRKNLLVSSALIAASISGAMAQPAVTAGPIMQGSVAHRDTNREFLCTYGSFYVGSSTQRYSSYWTHVAVPIPGHGKIVSKIEVMESPSAGTQSNAFSIGIYSNTANGIPGALITGAIGRANGPANACRKVTIPVPPTFLTRGKTYWVEESVPNCGHNCYNAVNWYIDPKRRRDAYEQDYYFLSSSSYSSSSSTSPWKKLNGGPYLKVR